MSLFDKQVEIANMYPVKGQKVHVEGILQSDPNTGGLRIYQRQDGTAGVSFEFRTNIVTYLGKPADMGANPFDPANAQ